MDGPGAKQATPRSFHVDVNGEPNPAAAAAAAPAKDEAEALPVRSWADPELREERLTCCKGGVIAIVLVAVIFVINLFFFLGSSWDPTTYYSVVRVAIVDLDGGLVGAALAAGYPNARIPFDYVLVTGVTWEELRTQVDRGDYNAAIVAMPNASSKLLAAVVSSAAPAYDASGALSLLFDEGRSGGTMNSLLRAASAGLAGALGSAVTRALLARMAAGTLSSAAMLTAGTDAALAMSGPVGLSENILHKAYNVGLQNGIGLGFIVNWVIMLVAVNVLSGVLVDANKAKVRRDHLLLLYAAALLGCSLWLAFWPPVVLTGLGGPLDARRFFAWWAWLWLTMTTFGCVVSLFLFVLGPSVGNLLHIAFLILNLTSSSAIAPFELMPAFFQIGLGLPFAQAVVGSRTIILGSYDRLGRSVGVLFAWLGLATLVLAYGVISARRAVHAAKAAGGRGGAV